MKALESFKPQIYNSLSRKEKMQCIENLTNEFFKVLKLPKINIKYTTNKVVGMFTFNPNFILLNELFLKDTINQVNSSIAAFTIAHECYHYYQFILMKKLINKEPLTEKEKEIGYLYLICAFTHNYNDYNQRLNIATITYIEDKILYKVSPIEKQANLYAKKTLDKLHKSSKDLNYLYLLNLLVGKNEAFINQYNLANGEHVETDALEYFIETFKIFLTHKSKSQALNKVYLDIDIEEFDKYMDKIRVNLELEQAKSLRITKSLNKKLK